MKFFIIILQGIKYILIIISIINKNLSNKNRINIVSKNFKRKKECLILLIYLKKLIPVFLFIIIN